MAVAGQLSSGETLQLTFGRVGSDRRSKQWEAGRVVECLGGVLRGPSPASPPPPHTTTTTTPPHPPICHHPPASQPERGFYAQRDGAILAYLALSVAAHKFRWVPLNLLVLILNLINLAVCWRLKGGRWVGVGSGWEGGSAWRRGGVLGGAATGCHGDVQRAPGHRCCTSPAPPPPPAPCPAPGPAATCRNGAGRSAGGGGEGPADKYTASPAAPASRLLPSPTPRPESSPFNCSPPQS